MSRAGQVNIQGVEFQVWAGLSLALQFLRQPHFKEVHLESPSLQDFDVVLENDSKYICEVKCWKRKFGKADLESVFTELNSRNAVIKEEDVILVIAPSISKDLIRKVESARFYSKHPEFARRFNIPENELKNLSKVEFWEVDLSNSVNICYSLVAQLVEAIVSKEDLKSIVHQLLVEDFLGGSKEGKIISRTDLTERIIGHRNRLFQRTGHSTLDLEARIKDAKEASQNSNHRFWKDADLTAASINFTELLVVCRILERRTDLLLSEWNKVWEGLLQTRLTHFIVTSFQNNLREENYAYISSFLQLWIPQLRPFYGYSFHDAEILELITSLSRSQSSSTSELLNLVEAFINSMTKKRFFVKKSEDTRYAQEKLGNCINSIFQHCKVIERSAVIDFILEKFNLVDDEGEFWKDAPPGIFSILHNYLRSVAETAPDNFKKEFARISDSLSKQYSENYKSQFRKRFTGTELMGGSSSWSGNNYKVFDRYFVRQVLSPALYYFYQQKPQEGIEFVLKLSSVSDGKISAKSPDFLRRATISTLMLEYRTDNTNNRKEAFRHLSRLIKSKRGMPSKHEIIFQSISPDLELTLREKLLKVAINLYSKPLNPFVFKEVVALAMVGVDWAIKRVATWFEEGSFGDSIFGCGPLPLIRVLLHGNLEEGIKALNGFVRSEYFLSKIRIFDVYEWCDLISELVQNNKEQGLHFISKLLEQEVLPVAQQTLVFSSLAKIATPDNSDSKLLDLVFEKIIVPLYVRFDWSQEKLSKFVTEPYQRQEIIELCEKTVQKFATTTNALSAIVRVLQSSILDPSPTTEELRESQLDGGRMVTIQTVRGKCAWSLQAMWIPLLQSYFHELVPCLVKLLNDPAAYVQRMACFPLAILLDRRNKTITELGVPFLEPDINKARLLRDDIENIAIEFIKRTILTAPLGLFHGLAEIVNSLRLASNAKTQEVWLLAEGFPEEALSECLGFALFQAEFRRKILSKEIIGINPMLQHVINEEDESDFFRTKLKKIALSGKSPEKSTLAWLVMKLTDREELGAPKDEGLSYEYEVTFRYFDMITDSYHKDAFLNVYMFIQENVEEHTDNCITLYKKALTVERDALRILVQGKERKDFGDSLWAPFSFNGDIILTIAELGREEEALSLLEFLLNYPLGLSVGVGERMINYLKNKGTPFNRIKQIFDRLVQQDPLKHIDRDEWIQRYS